MVIVVYMYILFHNLPCDNERKVHGIAVEKEPHEYTLCVLVYPYKYLVCLYEPISSKFIQAFTVLPYPGLYWKDKRARPANIKSGRFPLTILIITDLVPVTESPTSSHYLSFPLVFNVLTVNKIVITWVTQNSTCAHVL
jgi:hypothetical protein